MDIAVPDVVLGPCFGFAAQFAMPVRPCRYNATAPVVCGVAIDVPEIVIVDVSLSNQAERTSLPGANTSTTLPKLEAPVPLKNARLSFMSEAPTVSASKTRAGDLVPASTFSFPAAIT